MALRSFEYYKSQGDWSKYLTIKHAFSGDPGLFLGSVEDYGDLPSTVSEAKSLWSLGDYTVKVSDTAFSNADSSHGGNPSQYTISEIDGNNLSWKYQFSIPIPSGNFESISNKAVDFTVVNNTLYPSVKAVDDLFKSFHGLVAGGSTGQALVKKSNSDYDVEWVDGGSGGQPTNITSTDFLVGGSTYNRSIDIKVGGIVESQLASDSVSSSKIVNDAVITSKIADGNVTAGKLAIDSVSTDKIVNGAVTDVKLASDSVSTSKIVDKNVTVGKLAPGSDTQVLRTVGTDVVWDSEQDISDKADKFTYTPSGSTPTVYNLDDIKSFNVAGDGAGVNPNTGVIFTNFAGESVTIPISGDAGFFNYKGQVAVYEDLPDFDDDVSNGDLYSIAASIVYKGSVPAMEDLPANPAAYDQYYVTAPAEFIYWYADASLPDGGEWITNHCQTQDGCNDSGWYAFGVGDEPNWNRLDGELTVDQTLNTDSVNAIANRAVAQSLLTKLNCFSANTLSEFFNENDGGGLVYYDNEDDRNEVAGITLNTNVPQLYIHRYDRGGDLTNRVLVELHEDGLYISTVLAGTNWIRIATVDDINSLMDFATETNYKKNTGLRWGTIDTEAFNKYGIVPADYLSTDFLDDVDAGDIDELVTMAEFDHTLVYCIDNYFPSGYFENFRMTNVDSVTPKWDTSGAPLQYRIGNSAWLDAVNGEAIVLSSRGEISFRGIGRDSLFEGVSETNAWIIDGVDVELKGNINRLLDYKSPPLVVGDYAFAFLFYNNTGIISAPILSGTRLGNSCYYGMFSGCTGLIDAPVLHAIRLVNNCYHSMFSGCVSLENAPGSDRYTDYTPVQNNMFTDCEELVSPLRYCEIPVDFGGLGGCDDDHYLMITGSSSVTPVWTISGDPLEYQLGNDEWLNAVSGDSITTNDKIKFRGSNRDSLFTRLHSSNAWTVNGSDVVISGNFNALLDYQDPPSFIMDNAFTFMLNNCNSIKTVNAILPATSFGLNCYQNMFSSCSNLVKAPVLQATNLNYYCYGGMFSGCTSLVNAPALPATTLALYCYNQMFTGCINLETARNSDVYTTRTPEQNGMFGYCTNLKQPLRYCEIPMVWGGLGSCLNYFTITGSKSVTPKWTVPGSHLEYKLGNGTWINASSGINIVTNNVIMFRGSKRTSLFTSGSSSNAWVIEGDNVSLSGSINTLLNYSINDIPLGEYAFAYMFQGCSNIINGPVLPSTVLGDYCYQSMFQYCENLVDAPELPATTLAANCYQSMFRTCTNLVDAPELPATTLTVSCYNDMFDECSNLLNAPVLAATTLAQGCYYFMFSYCINLVDAPVLSNETLYPACYNSMFRGCNNLLNAPVLPATTLVSDCYSNMFRDCINLINAPELLAETLVDFCYQNMFLDCINLETALNSDVYTLTTPGQSNMFSNCNKLVYPIRLCAIPESFGGGGGCPDYFTITGSTSVTPIWTTGGNPLEYQIGSDSDWSVASSGYSITTGDIIRFRGLDRLSLFAEISMSNAWVIEGDNVHVSGEINSLLNYNNPLTIIGTGAFNNMFYNCGSLVSATYLKLSATTLGNKCYQYMFDGCHSLVTAPNLPAETLSEDCYYRMFNECNILETAPNSDNYTKLSPTQGGMFRDCTSLREPLRYCVIPTTWGGLGGDCNEFSIIGSTSVIPKWDGDTSNPLEYKLGDNEWLTISSGTQITTGNVIKFRGTGRTGLFTSDSTANAWTINGSSITLTGVILSLLDYNNPPSTLSDYAFNHMFYNHYNILYANELLLSARTLGNNCYQSMFEHCTNLVRAPPLPALIIGNNCYKNMFRDCKLVNVPVLPAETLSSSCYEGMFQGCTYLTDVSELSATTLASRCYYKMFYGCSELVNVPELPVRTLAQECYSYMFYNCEKLVDAPELPASTLVNGCYINMFNSCSKLETAPNTNIYTKYSLAQTDMFTGCAKLREPLRYCAIPTTWGGLGGDCDDYFTITGSTAVTPKWMISGTSFQYKLGTGSWTEISNETRITTGMVIKFRGTGRAGLCNNMENPWVIEGSNVSLSGNINTLLDYTNPPSTLAAYAFNYIFNNNNSIVSAAELKLPAITLGGSCYRAMFLNCTNLVDAPDLPATTLAGNCYYYMFSSCTSLIDAPELPATTLASTCYHSMFMGCNSLVNAPVLPTETLASSCYYQMFMNCTSLVEAPELLATSLVGSCYTSMFNGCINLETARNSDVYTLTTPTQTDMFSGCTKLAEPVLYCAIPISFGGLGGDCPADWFTITGSTAVTPRWSVTGDALQYKLGTAAWANATTSTKITTGDVIRFRGTGRTGLFNSLNPSNAWTITGSNVILSGEISTLVNYRDSTVTVSDYAFNYMFYNCSSIVNTQTLILTDTAANHSYRALFYNCINLVSVPDLPATILAEQCYTDMFNTCTSLVTAQAILPATTLADKCYQSMFNDCTNLVNVPALPAETLSNNCYTQMFYGCTSLTDAPELPATTLATYCYAYMFYGCNSLVDAPELLATTTFTYCYAYMFSGCTSLESAPSILPAAVLTNNCYNFMFNGCTSLVNAPELPAMTLANYCYRTMFSDCTSLTDAPELPAETLFSYCYNNMFSGCSKLETARNSDVYTLTTPTQASMFTGCTKLREPLPYCAIPTTFGGLGDCTDYFTITGSTAVTPKFFTSGNSFQYKLGTGNWTNVNSGIRITTGNIIMFRGTGRTGLFMEPNWSINQWLLEGTDIILSGNINTLLDYNNPPLSIGDYAFASMFFEQEKIVSAFNLEFTAQTLGEGAYNQMFMYCYNLVYSPNILSSMNLSDSCYSEMFSGCTSLVNAPSLPATTLITFCYYGMFANCENLENAPESNNYTKLSPAQASMFSACTKLMEPLRYCAIPTSFGGLGDCNEFTITGSTSVTPRFTASGTSFQYKLGTGNWTNVNSGIEITTGNVIKFRGTGRTSLFNSGAQGNAWTITGSNVSLSGNINSLLDYNVENIELSEHAFDGMFYACTSIISAPELPSTKLGEHCYDNMFRACTNLITVPILPARTLANTCYQNMFYDCTSLVNAPALPATTLAPYCYNQMFRGCINLSTTTTLPAETLSEGCYRFMFYGCTSLINAPNLMAQPLVDTCYENMFRGCTKLETAPNSDNYTTYSPAQANMFTDCNKLVEPRKYCEIPVSFGGSGYCPDYFTITGSTAVTPRWTTGGNALQYKLGDADWMNASNGNNIPTGNDIMFRGLGRTGLFNSNNTGNAWTITGSNINLSGNLNTLLNYLAPYGITLGNYCYNYMFYNCTNLVLAANLELPADTVSSYCYQGMFRNCGNLTIAPELRAIFIDVECYREIFSGCTSLVNAPYLGAETLVNMCYYHMFDGCTNLVNAPDSDVYTKLSPAQESMFANCTKLVSPLKYCEIPASFGGLNGDCGYFNITGSTAVTPRWNTGSNPLEYQLGGTGDWLTASSGTVIPTGVLIRFRGVGRISLFNSNNTDNAWTITGSNISIGGNINSLLDYNNPPSTLGSFAFNNMFNGCNGLVNAPALPATTISQGCYQNMFMNCTNLVNAPALPADTLTNSCYQSMFSGCTSLITAIGSNNYTDKIPAQSGMFSNCTKLVEPLRYCEIPTSFGGLGDNCNYFTITGSTNVTPRWNTGGNSLQYKLGNSQWINVNSGNNITTGNVIKFRGTGRTGLFNNAAQGNAWTITGSNVSLSGNLNTVLNYAVDNISLSENAFNNMFYGCTSIINAPELSAITIGNQCYSSMFHNCTNLTSAPNLPATTLGVSCYNNMFNGCTSLVNIPSTLPATILSESCYYNMFTNCINLENVPSLSSTTLANYCYEYMFKGCAKLRNSPSLPAATLTQACYEGMFWDCASLNSAPNLSATALAQECYQDMFRNCTSLVNAPSLPATTLNPSCYYEMFWGCTSLVNAPALNAGTLVYNCYSRMFIDCGNLVNAVGSNTYITYSPAQEDMFKNCIKLAEPRKYCEIPTTWGGLGGDCGEFTITGSTAVTPKWSTSGNNLQYKLGSGEWLDATKGNSITTGDVIRFRGTGRTALFNYNANTNAWTIEGSNVSLSGNINNLLDHINPLLTVTDYGFCYMFYGCTSLTSISNLKLPATTVGSRCYMSMYEGCTNLINLPSELPATTLGDQCYVNMFNGCNIVTTPTLPATTLASTCYSNMFSGCTKLKNISPILATTLANRCYQYMFRGCTSLVNAPNLTVTTLATYCYDNMFYGCTSLVNAPALPATVMQSYCYYYMFSNCTALVNAPTLNSTTLANNCYQYMFSGCTSLVNAPALPATVMQSYCYSSMFDICIKLEYAPILAAETLANYCYMSMFRGCTSLVTAPALPATTLVTACYAGMFSSCVNLENAIGNDRYTGYPLGQQSMFYGCTKVITTIPYCEIPTSFGGLGGCNFLTLTNTTNVTPKWTTDGDPLQYKLGDGEWTDAVSGDSISTGDIIRFRGSGRTSLFTASSSANNSWIITGDDVIINGNFNSLLDYSKEDLMIGQYAFAYLLYNCDSITTVNATLPATVLAEHCYYRMFSGCTGLLEAPVLPATELVKYCYYYMFLDCTSLTEAPGADRYTKYNPSQGAMFGNCKALIKPLVYTKLSDSWK